MTLSLCQTISTCPVSAEKRLVRHFGHYANRSDSTLTLRFYPPFSITENQICGMTFVGLTNATLKQLDPNISYFQRRILLREIKDAVEGTRTAASVSSIGAENMNTPSPGSGSPVLLRLGSGSRPMVMSPGGSVHSPYANAHHINNSSGSVVPLSSELGTIRTSFDQEPLSTKMYRSPTDESTGSSSATPLALKPASNQSRPSLDYIEPLEEVTTYEFTQHQIRPSNSPRPMSDPDLRLLPGRLPAHVTIETTEFNHKLPNIAPRQSSIAYSAINYRPNLNVPPQIVPRGSSRDYSSAHGLNVPQSSRGMSPISPPSPDGGNYSYSPRHQEPAFGVKDVPGSSKNGPSLIERRNNPVPHIQTHLDPQGSGHYQNGQRPSYDIRAGPPKSEGGPYSDATVVGGTLGFGRRSSHKRNHSSADVIQYPPPAPVPHPVSLPMAPPKVCVDHYWLFIFWPMSTNICHIACCTHLNAFCPPILTVDHTHSSHSGQRKLQVCRHHGY